ncbi:hypothetical protein E1B28_005943 [Marasmius oreades]|uniref:Uncharacterized protein n=1 Tax=Marasmius oreades TaxID=181124 RepID=A0A9P7UWA3_9AGAR|nr:uncharacterized protein E1B28_005943 [Marasmius oreades]KAG7095164.1 hypothetical protein E1B28_005943 [Marasmius oreades]
MPNIPDCFQVSEQDKTKAYCTICARGTGRKYISLKSAKDHIKSSVHVKAEQLFNAAKAEEAVIREKQTAELKERERLTNAPPIMLRPIHLIPKSDFSKSFPEDLASNMLGSNDEFWDSVNHDLGPSVGQTQENHHRELEVDLDKALGVWNSIGFADVLGDCKEDDQEALLRQQEEEELLADVMAGAAMCDHQFHQVLYGATHPTSSHWDPYDSKTMCILDVLDNLQRHRISDSLMKLIIWALKECGVQDTPSFYALRKKQAELCNSQGVPNIECKSVQGNIFYINDIRAIIAHDWTNPQTRRHIHIYPEIPETGTVTEVWHAEKWRRTMNLDILSPMFDGGNSKHFYVFELSRLRNGELVIPIHWLTYKGKVVADAFSVSINEHCEAHINDTETKLILADELEANYLDLEYEKSLPSAWTALSVVAGHIERMPNKYQKLADGDPIYTSFISYFGDDVSGNRSKSWNKHNNSYITHQNLPRKLLQQEFHVHLISTSQVATIVEQYQNVKHLIDSTHTNPICIQDPATGNPSRFMIRLYSDPSDNPAQSDVASHIGAKGNYPCQKCEMGGTEDHRSTNEGFHSIFKPGTPRTSERIKNELNAQVKLACCGISKPIQERQTATGTKDAYTQYWIDQLINRFRDEKLTNPNSTTNEIQNKLLSWVAENDKTIYNGFLTTEGFDPAQDTPIEILHTVLLGLVKYIWHYTQTKWTEKQKIIYGQCLQATDTDGLSIQSIRAEYIVHFANSLIGRQFKAIVQTAVFHIYDLVDTDHFRTWKAVATLSALLWHVEIDNMDQYCHDVETATANVLDMFAVLDPTKILREDQVASACTSY